MSPLRNLVLYAIDVPRDLVLDEPRITIIGGGRVVIENHKGILEHTSSALKVAYRAGVLVVRGTSIVLRSISSDEIMVEGRISHVSLEGPGGEH